MTHRVIWAPSARRQMENTIPPDVGVAIWNLVNGALADDPRRVGKPLRYELDGLWCARRGDYRVIYRITDDTIAIVRVDHRRDAYHTT